MKRDNGWRIILVLLVVIFSGWSLIPSIRVFSQANEPEKPLKDRAREVFKRSNPKVANKAINLGLDLAGGTHIIVEVMKDQVPEDQRHDVLDRSLEIVRNRVDQYGLSEPVITKSGDNKIVADLAGLDAEDSRRLIGATALLEFKLVVEADQFSPVLKKLDDYLSRKKTNLNGAGSNDSLSAVESVFGRVVEDSNASAKDSADMVMGDSSALVSDSTSDTVAAAKTEQDSAMDDFIASKPFSAKLMQVGSDVGVREKDYEQLRNLLETPELRKQIPPTLQFLWSREVEAVGTEKVRRLYLLKRRPEMTGKYIQDATFNRVSGGINAGDVEVELSFKGLGPKEFARITRANIGRQLAIVLDSVVYSAPVIQGAIANGRASITGMKDIKEAKQLAVTLRAGSLPAPMKIVELRAVGPTLGEDNIQSGMRASIIAFLLVVSFMVFYYRAAGIISNIALLLNLVITFAVLSAFHATLTLPGIAGIVLTIGMAVDANVIIFERIREELALGKTVRSAIDAGYKKAFSAIFDSNVTTIGTAAVLYWIGVGPIKGFGLTLMIGIATSMFTSLFVSRLLFDLWIGSRDVKTLNIGKGISFLQNTNLQIVAKARVFVIASVALLVICALSVILHHGVNPGIDFKGGHVFQVRLESEPNLSELRSNLAKFGYESAKVQVLGSTGQNEVLVSLPMQANDSVVLAQIKKAIPKGEVVSEEVVAPTIGKQLTKSALMAFFLSLILIIAYIWVRFGRNGLGYGLGGVVALTHDALFTFLIFNIFGMELSLNFVAAIMTILGYSLNDSIIIFDRIRELTEGKGVSKGSYATKVNDAINQTLSRTVITSFTSIIAVLVMAIIGGGSIRDFNIAILVGFISGVYSTIGIAAPFVVWWNNRRVMAGQVGA